MPGTKHIRVHGLVVEPDDMSDVAASLAHAAAKHLGCGEGELPPLQVIRRSLDARKRRPLFRFSVDLEVDTKRAERWVDRGVAEWAETKRLPPLALAERPDGPPPVVVGAGPAGLFAALTLAEAGWPPILVERGQPVEQRSRDVSKLYSRGVLNPESNVCFGEGGAGTYSDGKLYTRVSHPRVRAFMEKLVELGANADILVNSRPHLGTDKLVNLMQSIRRRLEELGTKVLFNTRMERIFTQDGHVSGIELRGGERVDSGAVILATGHSARHVWDCLQSAGAQLECRPFSMGFRVEHPQAAINTIQYGERFAEHPALPAADYRLTHQDQATERGVYSFCMCPGGVVVTTPTEADHLCINGMSHAARSGRFANSALVVTVGLEDFAAAGFEGVFAGVDFQRSVEADAYALGGGDFVAPASTVTDFLEGRSSRDLGSTSYRRGLQASDLTRLYPPVITEALQRGLHGFDRRLRGFVTAEAKLIGVETRTASPVRVHRGEDFQAVGVSGLYPSGEGMGYGGGIASAAVDGIRVARTLLESVGANEFTPKP